MTKIFEQETATFQQTCLSKRDYFIMNESLLYLFSDKLKKVLLVVYKESYFLFSLVFKGGTCVFSNQSLFSLSRS